MGCTFSGSHHAPAQNSRPLSAWWLPQSALTITSPFNLIKNEKYGNNSNIKEIYKNFKFNKLGLKYAYIRMGLGFYVNQIIYDLNKKLLLFK